MSPRFSFPTATELRVYLIQSTYGLDHRRFITDEKAGLSSATSSRLAPLPKAMTGVPSTTASIITVPIGSGQRDRHQHPVSLGRAALSSGLPSTGPTKRTDPLESAVRAER